MVAIGRPRRRGRVRNPVAAARERARVAGALFVTGSALGFVSLTVLPAWRVNVVGVVVVLGVAAVAGLSLLVFAAAVTTPVIHAAVVVGVATIAALQVLTGGAAAGVAVGLLYVWIAVFAALYFSPAVTAGYVGLTAAAQAFALASVGANALLPQLVLTIGTCAAAAVVVAILAGRLRHRASTDALTQLANRARALVLIEAGLHRARRRGTMAALLFIDLDYFKLVNDSHGHRAGDTVLTVTAERMRRAVRGDDLVARLGGDEFVIFLEDVAGSDRAAGLAERLVKVLGERIDIDGATVRVGASIGVVLSGDSETDPDRMLSDADTAAYEAKKAGRGRCVVLDEALRRELARRVTLDRDISGALTAGEFELYYQPLVDLHARSVRSVEALIRWNKPGHGLVCPDEFIPQAETSRIINDIGRWVLTEATSQLARWDNEPGAENLRMAVNISGRHLASSELAADVQAALDASGVDPCRLIIEVTETVLVNNPAAVANLTVLRQLGVRISIDDFGTGFTSIGELLTMPIDELKIDRSFVASSDPGRWELVTLMAHAAHTLGAEVVAEGIETTPLADSLAAAGIEYGQGYLFAQPTQAHETLATIRNIRFDTATRQCRDRADLLVR